MTVYFSSDIYLNERKETDNYMIIMQTKTLCVCMCERDKLCIYNVPRPLVKQ